MATRILAVLLSGLVWASTAAAGEVTFNGSNRFLFDVEGHHISAYALKIYCELLFRGFYRPRLLIRADNIVFGK